MIINEKTLDPIKDQGFLKVASTYSPTLKRAVPSAQVGLTSLFGMGRGGPHRNRHLNDMMISKSERSRPGSSNENILVEKSILISFWVISTARL